MEYILSEEKRPFDARTSNGQISYNYSSILVSSGTRLPILKI